MLDLQYMPCILYFVVLRHAGAVVFDVHEHFEKQSYRNRCVLLGANGPLRLSVPVKGAGKKILTRHIGIDYKHHWQKDHLRAIQSAYGKAPFFEYYWPQIQHIFAQKPATLAELNYDFLAFACKALQILPATSYSTAYINAPKGTLADLRGHIHPKKDWQKLGLLAGRPYYQVFGKDFVPNLSILDLLFCEGPGAAIYLRDALPV